MLIANAETENRKPDMWSKLFRNISAFFDGIAFFLLSISYELFFNVASAELFTNETIKAFYGRMQLIIGVFMVFKLAVTILQGIVNPDTFTDKKSGFSSIITRIIFALVMLVLIVPINIPNAKTEYEIQLNNNGLLFGTLYSLQNRLLSNNTLGRLVLGTDDGFSSNTKSGEEQSSYEQMQEMVNIFSSTILKGFVRINLKPEEERIEPPEGKTDEMINENRMCEDIDDEVLNTYTSLDSSTEEILYNIHETCGHGNKKRYVFTYKGLLSAIVATIFAVILIGYTVDIAVRAVKLAVLRILAPIPIISYMHPSKDNGAFGAWVKTLTSTYIDVFLRLAVVYFIIFLIQDMIVHGIVINNGTGRLGILSAVFIWIGLFLFARQAPKFIRDVLGLKGHMSNIGLSGVLGGTASLLGGGGLAGAAAAAINGAESALQGEATGKPVPLGQSWANGRDLAAQIRTGDPKARGGIINNVNDRLMRAAGVNAARRDYGVTANGLAIAKTNMQNASAAAAELEDQYNRYTRGNMSVNEQDQFARDNAQNIQNYMNQGYSREDAIRRTMYDRMTAAQTRASKAKGHYEDAKKFADSHRITPSFEEEHRRSIRERIGLGDNPRNRDDYVATSGRRTSHQNLGDRVLGSPEDWRDSNSERNDNRWNPNVYNDNDTNQIHDNPHDDIHTPGNN